MPEVLSAPAPQPAPGAPAIVSRDGRHYCTPTCAAQPRRAAAPRGYPGAVAAEAAGLRPCLSCRPERFSAPPGRTAAARRVRRGALLQLAFAADDAALARTLGVSRPRLAREYVACCGVTPAVYAETQRRLLALQLLGDTSAPLTDVARACGYADVAALERALHAAYGASAAALRAARTPGDAAAITLALPYAPPYAWPHLLRFLQSRTIDGCEDADLAAGHYRRTLRAAAADGPRLGWVEAVAADDTLALQIAPALLPALPTVLTRAWYAFDLGAEPRSIQRVLGPLARGAPGLRLPGTFDAFELVVRAILGQQITVKAARTLASRFVAAFGTAIETPFPSLQRVFPAPATVAALSVDAIASLGIIGARTRTILTVARALAEGRLHLEPGGDLARTLAELKAVRGIGEWTAQYVAMRALAAQDAFPHTDYGVMKALGERNPKRVLAQGEAWRPYRAYAVLHLWRSLG